MRSTLILGLLGAVVSQARGLDLERYRVKSTSKYTKASDAAADSGLGTQKSERDYVGDATALVMSVAPDATFRVIKDHYVGTNDVAHVYFKQTVNGIDIDNAVLNVNIGKDGGIISYGNSFFAGELPAKKEVTSLSAIDAMAVVQDKLELAVSINLETRLDGDNDHHTIKGVSGVESDPEAEMVYFVKPDGQLALTWKIQTQVQHTSYSSYVDAGVENGELVGVLDHVSHASYQVYPFGINDPREGEREIIEDPEHPEASKLGWYNTELDNDRPGLNTSFGNNIEAGGVTPPSGEVIWAYSETLNFSFPYEPDSGSPIDFRDAAVTQIFYTTNMLHDLYYILGFTPAAGNFQDLNGDEGGLEGDAVYAVINYIGDRNNGFFTQAIDGRQPRLTMLLFDSTDPLRDGGFDNGFVIHEYTHGLSDRLTGGPQTSGCLEAWEADGMAEGWSDLFAAALTIKPDETRENATYGFAAWPTNSTDPPTARLVMYSTNMDVNDWTYSNADGLDRVHEVGTVWCTMLYEVLWNLIDKHGKNDNPRPELVDGVPTDGKFLMLKLLIDAFAIQPCNPSFIDARDAILDADLALTGGDNACEIWTGFAKRGLGANAVVWNESEPRVDNFEVPDGLC